MVNDKIVNSPSSSGFIVPADFSSEWRDISLLQTRSRTQIYTASRYGRRFVLKGLTPETASLTDYRLQQEQEFQLGIQLVHPNIAATYSLEEIDGVGRCIVQEWIDGMTLGEWLKTKPSKAARKRVFSQLLDALEYIHSLQLVHHDLKPDNILITRNGANVKLIDFGLSATDATITPVPNDPRKDIEALQRLFPDICPKGQFANISALRKVLNRRNRLMFLLPVLLSAILLAAAAALLYISWQERQSEQQRIDELNAQIAAYAERERAQLEKQKRYEAMCAQMDSILAQERAQIMEIVNRRKSYDTRNPEEMAAYSKAFSDWNDIAVSFDKQRDSLTNLFDETDPLREQFWQRWVHQYMDIYNELVPQLTDKLKQ
ncbi:MAG: serine/threonine-protein kinase [Paludibacteraceae bacterium]